MCFSIVWHYVTCTCTFVKCTSNRSNTATLLPCIEVIQIPVQYPNILYVMNLHHSVCRHFLLGAYDTVAIFERNKLLKIIFMSTTVYRKIVNEQVQFREIKRTKIISPTSRSTTVAWQFVEC